MELLARWPPAHFEGSAAQHVTQELKGRYIVLFSSTFQYLGNNMFKHKNLIEVARLYFLQFLQFTAICQEAKARGSHVLVGVHSDHTLQLGETRCRLSKYTQIFPAFFRDCFGCVHPPRGVVFLSLILV